MLFARPYHCQGHLLSVELTWLSQCSCIPTHCCMRAFTCLWSSLPLLSGPHYSSHILKHIFFFPSAPTLIRLEQPRGNPNADSGGRTQMALLNSGTAAASESAVVT